MTGVLVLSRKKNEAIVIDGKIEIRVLEIKGDTVRLGVMAPDAVKVYRQEIHAAIMQENLQAQVSSHNLAVLKELQLKIKQSEEK